MRMTRLRTARRLWSLLGVGGMLAVGAVAASSPAQAANGTVLRTITAASPSCSVGTGLGFDGTQLLTDCWGSNQIWGVSPADGSLQHTYTISGVSDLGALAWDRGRGKLWACNSDTQVYLIDLATQSATLQFTSQGCIDGLAYDGSDDTIWASADAASSVQHYTSAGIQFASTDVSAMLGNCGNSGLAVGGSQLLLANDGCQQIYLAPKDLSSASLFGTYPARLEDLECDDLTFTSQGKAAIWSKDAYDNTLNAFELNPGTCGYGGQVSQFATTDVVVSNSDSGLKDKQGTTNEPSIAVNPKDPSRVVIASGFEASADRYGPGVPNAPLWYSKDGGKTWGKFYSIPAPPRRSLTGCPCDTTISYARNGTLYLSMLSAPSKDGVFGVFTKGADDVYTASNSGDPTKPSDWHWRLKNKIAQATDNSNYNKNSDQPWVETGPTPGKVGTDNVYVGFDYFGSKEQARVAASLNGATPPDFTQESSPGGFPATVVNPGLRLATDPRTGALYALWESGKAGAVPDVPTVTYHLNRSTDGGKTWSLNGSSSGIVVATTPSYQGSSATFGKVDELRGGVDHLAVDPNSSAVYVAYGANGVSQAGNQLLVRKYTLAANGQLQAGTAVNVTGTRAAALPSLAVRSDGTVGLLYTSADDETTIGSTLITTLTAHFATSSDGQNWHDDSLQSYTINQDCSSACGDGRQLGDYERVVAVGNSFYGVFPASRSAYDAHSAKSDAIDPVFFTR